MSKYMILIYEREEPYATLDEAGVQQVYEAHGRFAGQVVELGGTLLGGAQLEPVSTATSIRDDVVTDGPFAETKEVLGGYYLIEANDLDQALQIAKLCPAQFGGVEVRPLVEGMGG